MKIKWRIVLILILSGTATGLVWVSLWQQEIVLMDTFEGRRFNFMGTGDWGLEWWTWRDIFYFWIIIAIPLFMAVGYLIGTIRVEIKAAIKSRLARLRR